MIADCPKSNSLYGMFVLGLDGKLAVWTGIGQRAKTISVETMRDKFDSGVAALYRNSLFSSQGGPQAGLMSAEISFMGGSPQFYSNFYRMHGGNNAPPSVLLPSNWYMGADGSSHVEVRRHVTGLSLSFGSLGKFFVALASKGTVAALETFPGGWVTSAFIKSGLKGLSAIAPVGRAIVVTLAVDQSFKIDTEFRVVPGMGILPAERCPTPPPLNQAPRN